MRKLISLITLFSFSIQAATITDDKLTVGKKASASAKEIVFDTNDGANNKKLSVDKITKKLSATSDEVIVGDGTASDKALTFNRGGSNAQVKWNEVTDKLQFSNDGTTFKDLGTGGGGGGSTGVNVLTNDSFEDAVGGVITDWSNTGGTLTQVSYTNSVEGDAKYFQFVATTSGQYFEMVKTVPTNFNGQGCQVDFKKLNIATSDLFKVEALDASNNVLATGNVKVSSWQKFPTLSFVCPAAGATFKIRVTSLAAGTLQGDKAYLGSNQNLIYTSQAKLIGSLTYATTASCSWITSSATYANFAADTDCPTATVTGNASAPATKIPGITFSNMPAGDYVFIATGQFTMGASSGSASGFARFSDGTNFSTGVLGAKAATGATTNLSGSNTVVGRLSYGTSQSNVTIQLQGLQNGANSFVVENESSATFQIQVYHYPLSSDVAISPEQASWFIDANIGGANITTTNSASYIAFENASLDLVINPGSAPAKIACSSTNAATGLTCSSGSEQAGIVFTNALIGRHKVCVYGAGEKGNITSATTQLIETAPASQAIVAEGGTRLPVSVANANATPVNMNNCGYFNWGSIQERAIRYMYESDNTALILHADRGASVGQRDIRITVENVDFGQSRPFLTNDQLTSPGSINPVHYTFSIDPAGGVSEIVGTGLVQSCTSAAPHVCTFNSGKLSGLVGCLSNVMTPNVPYFSQAHSASSGGVSVNAYNVSGTNVNNITSKMVTCWGKKP